ncbi:hypothetical protein [Paraburkholderia sp. 40]|uniref:hypothetical protein n=1 Tax=unclassified Paraburkholderia TaxID=2615204 RepID=UPI003D1CD6C4
MTRPSVGQIMRARLCLGLAVRLGTNRKQLPRKKRQAKNNQSFMKRKAARNGTRNKNRPEQKRPEEDDVRAVIS